jgi:hypothetical protein
MDAGFFQKWTDKDRIFQSRFGCRFTSDTILGHPLSHKRTTVSLIVYGPNHKDTRREALPVKTGTLDRSALRFTSEHNNRISGFDGCLNDQQFSPEGIKPPDSSINHHRS